MLLVDDLSVLLSLGLGAVAVLDFVHYCRVAVCWERKVLMGLLSALLPVTSVGRRVDTSLACSGLSCVFAWGFGFTACHCLPLLKKKGLKMKRLTGTVLAVAGRVRLQ